MGDGTAAARKRALKSTLYAAAARVPAALANRHRLELLDLVTQRPRTVQDLAAETGLTVANASQHLLILARAGLITVKRKGTYAHYHAADVSIYRLLAELRSVATAVDPSIAEAWNAFGSSGEPLIETFAEAQRAALEPGTALLDTRPREEFDAGHLPGAISAPLDALRAGKVVLPRSKRYVVYCRGPFCVFADEAARWLRGRGFEVSRLTLGPPEWKAAGGELEHAG